MDDSTGLEDFFIDTARLAAAYRANRAGAAYRPVADAATIRARSSEPLPEAGLPGPDVIARLAELAGPGLHATIAPRFYGWVIGGSDPVGVAADWLTAAWGQNAGNHVASPAAAGIEAVAADWLLEVLRLPPTASVGFVTGATVANFTCLAAARGRVLADHGWDVESRGLFGAPEIEVLIGDDAHTTVFHGLQMLGLGHDRVTRVATDSEGAMRLPALEAALSRGHGPRIVIAQAGQINTGAIDPVGEIVARAHPLGAWVHVDGAFGLWARAAPELASLAEGVEQADSWATDGHKWLQVPYDSGYAIVRDAAIHARAMTASASYLPPAMGQDRDPSHFVPELSRRARGFATWAVLKHLGRSGVADMVTRHCRLAQRLAARLDNQPGIERLNTVTLNQIILRFGPPGAAGDDLTRAVIRHLQDSGQLFAGGASWRGQQVMRLSIINNLVTEADIDATAAAILGALSELA